MSGPFGTIVRASTVIGTCCKITKDLSMISYIIIKIKKG